MRSGTQRESICLNGLWEFSPGEGKLSGLPDFWESTRIEVPSPWNINSFAAPVEGEIFGNKYFLRGGEYHLFPAYPKEWEKAKSGWYKTVFTVPEEWKGRRITLKFNAVHFYSEFYINGQKVAQDMDGFLPFEFDIGREVHYGEPNTLIVGVEKLDLFTVKLEGETESEKFEHPTGSFWGGHIAGIWQDVFLNCCPEIKIEDIFIQTDVLHNMLTARLELSGCESPLTLEYAIRKKGSSNDSLLGTQSLAAGQKELCFSYDYTWLKDRIELWWPHSPQLYILSVRLKSEETVIDTKEAQFGFRSFAIEGSRFVLNGTPINLRNDSWHYMGFAYQTEEYARLWYKMAKDAHVNCIRLHAQVYPEFFLDIADEMGMLIIDESSLWASHCRMHYSDQLIENTKKHLERLVRRDRNHPSVVIWSVENECIPAYRVHGDTAVADEEELNIKLYKLAEHVKSLDPGRPTSADGSFDLGGRMDILSLHYPGKEKTVKTDKPITIGEAGSMYYSSPDCVCNITGGDTYLSFDKRLEALGREAFDHIREQRKWASQVCVFNLVWYGLYPLPIREKMLRYEDHSLPGIKPARIGSYISTLNAGFDENLPEYMPNPVFYWVQKAYMPERFFLDDKVRYYSGHEASKKISIFNDSLEEKNYKLSWRLRSGERILIQGALSILIPPAQYREPSITFTLPETKNITSFRFEAEMRDDRGPVFSDYQILKVTNKASILESIGSGQSIAFVGDKGLYESFFKGTGFRFYSAEEVLDQASISSHELFVLGKNIGSDIYNELNNQGKRILDLSCQTELFTKWGWQNPVEKIFLNIDSSLLASNLDEEDLCGWRNGFVSSSSLSDFMNVNARHLFVNGKGTPVISSLEANGSLVVLSAVDLLEHIMEEPAALILLTNLIRYALNEKIRTRDKVTLIADASSELTALLAGMNISFERMDMSDKERIKAMRHQPLLIVDGTGKLDFIDELTEENTEKLVLFGLASNNTPESLKGYFNIENMPLNQLVKSDRKEGCPEDEATEGIHPGDLYGLEAGNSTLLSEHPIAISDGNKITGLLKNSSIDWSLWNMQGEDRKTAAMARNAQEARRDVYGLVKMQHNGIQVYINQICTSSSNYKLKKLLCTMLGNLDVRIDIKEIDEFEAIVNDGIYEQEVKRMLKLGPLQEQRPEALKPALNKQEEGLYWRISQTDDTPETGKFAYGLYIYSPSDRTDLLLNPDLAGIQTDSSFEKSLYLNGSCVATGRHIEINALKLKAGWNLLLILENRDSDKPGKLHVRFTRKDNRPLDLGFSLNRPGSKPITSEKWTFDASAHCEDCAKAIQGRGILWDSVDSQARGMYFRIDMGGLYTVSGLHFNSKVVKFDHIQWNTPRCFSVLASRDGRDWSTVSQIKNENELTIIDGKLILNFEPFEARFVELRLENVANKRFMISELAMYSDR